MKSGTRSIPALLVIATLAILGGIAMVILGPTGNRSE